MAILRRQAPYHTSHTETLCGFTSLQASGSQLPALRRAVGHGAPLFHYNHARSKS